MRAERVVIRAHIVVSSCIRKINKRRVRMEDPLRRDIRARGQDELILVGSYLELRETRRGTLALERVEEANDAEW